MNIYDLVPELGAVATSVVQRIWKVLVVSVLHPWLLPFIISGWLGCRWVFAFLRHIFLYLVQFGAI